MSKAPLTNGQTGFRYYTSEATLMKCSEPESPDQQKAVEPKQQPNTKLREAKLRTGAIVISWISAVFSVVTGIAAIVLGQMMRSQSLFGYGLDGVLDSLSSAVVLWRFYESGESDQTEARERKACIFIALLFFVSALSLMIKSVFTVAYKRLGTNDLGAGHGRLLTVVISASCGVIALVIAVIKVYLGRELRSQVLIIDSIITFVGVVISFLGVLGLELYEEDKSLWWLDALFGLCCGLFLFLFGLKLLIRMTCLYKKKEANETDIEEKP